MINEKSGPEPEEVHLKNLVDNIEVLLVNLTITGPGKEFSGDWEAEIRAKLDQLSHTIEDLRKFKPNELDLIFLQSLGKMSAVIPQAARRSVIEILHKEYLK